MKLAPEQYAEAELGETVCSQRGDPGLFSLALYFRNGTVLACAKWGHTGGFTRDEEPLQSTPKPPHYPKAHGGEIQIQSALVC